MNIKTMIVKHLEYLKTINRSPYTIRGARFILLKFARYLDNEDIMDIEDITRDILEEYQQELMFSFTNKGTPVSVRTCAKEMGTIKVFTRYLYHADYLSYNPGQHIKLPKEPKTLPKAIMTPEEVKKLLNTPDTRTLTGYRDRVILELLYDTAIRRLEIVGIKLPDLDLETGYIRISGKGNKERVVPVSTRVCELTQNYLTGIRPDLLRDKEHLHLILTQHGKPIGPNRIWKIVKNHVKKSGIKKNISTHTFRHTCATHMLRNGAPIRHIQQLLGHESLDTTQIYTRVTINDLKEAHSKYHPGSSNDSSSDIQK